MAVLVRIPTPLRTLTKGTGEVQATGETVAGLVDDLERQFPGIRDRLLDETGELRRFINVYVNEEDIRFLDGQKTALKAGDHVSIVPAIAGGAGA
jgi:sulfur-carrier protein